MKYLTNYFNFVVKGKLFQVFQYLSKTKGGQTITMLAILIMVIFIIGIFNERKSNELKQQASQISGIPLKDLEVGRYNNESNTIIFDIYLSDQPDTTKFYVIQRTKSIKFSFYKPTHTFWKRKPALSLDQKASNCSLSIISYSKIGMPSDISYFKSISSNQEAEVVFKIEYSNLEVEKLLLTFSDLYFVTAFQDDLLKPSSKKISELKLSSFTLKLLII
jgi:hypothetical protein